MRMFKILSDLPMFGIDMKPEDCEGKKYGIAIQAQEVSDGYHTMHELYEHRLALTVALIRAHDSHITPLGGKVKCWKSKLHSDGTMFPGNYFIVGMSWPEFDKEVQISYHYTMKHWDKFKCVELPKAPPYDGHTAQDTIERLLKL